MSTMAPEAPPAAPAPTSGKRPGGNVFTRKLGPLPMWVWLVIGIAVIVGIAYWKNRNAAQQTPTGTGAGQVPQFVNQTYTTVTPPTAPQPAPFPPPIFNGPIKDDDDDDDDGHHRRKKPKRHHRRHQVRKHEILPQYRYSPPGRG